MISALGNTLISFFVLIVLITVYTYFINRRRQLTMKRSLLIILLTVTATVAIYILLLYFNVGQTIMQIIFILLPLLVSFAFSKIFEIKKP